jgi:hypothetical protein
MIIQLYSQFQMSFSWSVSKHSLCGQAIISQEEEASWFEKVGRADLACIVKKFVVSTLLFTDPHDGYSFELIIVGGRQTIETNGKDFWSELWKPGRKIIPCQLLKNVAQHQQ